MYTHPAIWCHDDWRCNTLCPKSFEEDYPENLQKSKKNSPCFSENSMTGLASCLYGPKAVGSTSCYNPQDSSWKDDCVCNIVSGNNCMTGCAENFEDLSRDAVCCCKPGDGCPNVTIPSVCQISNIHS